MKNTLLCLALIFSFLSSAQEKWSLEQCINYAKKNSIEIVTQQLQNKAINEDVTIAKGNYFPNLSFSGSQGYSLGNSFNVSTGVGQQESRFNSFSLSSSVNIFNGFSNRYKLQQARLTTEKGKVDLEKLGLDLSLNIANQYLKVLFNKEILAVAKEQEIISEDEVNRLNQLFQAAIKSKSELLEMESTYALDKKEAIIAQNNINNSLIELRELLDVKDLEAFDIEGIAINEIENNIIFSNTNTIFSTALENNPLLKSTLLSTDISEKNIKIANAGYYPRLDFNYSYSSSYYHIQGREDLVFNQQTNQFENNGFLVQLNNNRTHYLGFSLTVPIFNKFITRSGVDKSKIELEIAQVELENQKKELKNKIEIAYNDVQTAKASLEASETALIAQKEAFSIAQNKYQEGFLTAYEFLESKSKYIQTQSELIKSKYDFIFKIKVLEYYEN